MWASGSPVPIVVVDGDVNKNSRADDDLSVSDINSIVPTLVTGDPFTLSEISDEIIIWIGVDLDTVGNTVANTEYERLIASANEPVPDSELLQYTHGYELGFRIGGITSAPDGVWKKSPNPDPRGEHTDDRIGIRSVTTVEEFQQQRHR